MIADDLAMRAAVVSYRALLVFFPPAFRTAYAVAMTQAFRDRCRATFAGQGRWR